MFLALNPATGAVLCKDYKFRTIFCYGTGSKTPKIYKTIGGAHRASERLGTPEVSQNFTCIARSVSLDSWNESNLYRQIHLLGTK